MLVLTAELAQVFALWVLSSRLNHSCRISEADLLGSASFFLETGFAAAVNNAVMPKEIGWPLDRMSVFV